MREGTFKLNGKQKSDQNSAHDVNAVGGGKIKKGQKCVFGCDGFHRKHVEISVSVKFARVCACVLSR